jgi:hypothetical protein
MSGSPSLWAGNFGVAGGGGESGTAKRVRWVAQSGTGVKKGGGLTWLGCMHKRTLQVASVLIVGSSRR